MASVESARARLRLFGERVGRSSPLYSTIALAAAEDDDVVLLASEAPDDDGQAMLLLAAVHYLAQQSESTLNDFYPTLGGEIEPSAQAWSAFREFTLDHREEVRAILQTKFVQTNEVQRAAVVYPAFATIVHRVQRPISVVEVGCSAGLLLSFDRYSYRYTRAGCGETRAGYAESRLRLNCDAQGAFHLDPVERFSIVRRIGLDRNPIDCQDPEQMRWLEACVWADQPERVMRLRKAAHEHRTQDVLLFTGDAVGGLATAVDATSEDTPVVVLTSWLLVHLSQSDQIAFLSVLEATAKRREVWWVVNETYESSLGHLYPRDHLNYRTSGRCVVAVARVDGRTKVVEVLGEADVHGKSLHGLSGAPVRFSW